MYVCMYALYTQLMFTRMCDDNDSGDIAQREEEKWGRFDWESSGGGGSGGEKQHLKKDDINVVVYVIDGWSDGGGSAADDVHRSRSRSHSLLPTDKSVIVRKKLLVPVGAGKQTFKWLSNVVQTRIQEDGGIKQGAVLTSQVCLGSFSLLVL